MDFTLFSFASPTGVACLGEREIITLGVDCAKAKEGNRSNKKVASKTFLMGSLYHFPKKEFISQELEIIVNC